MAAFLFVQRGCCIWINPCCSTCQASACNPFLHVDQKQTAPQHRYVLTLSAPCQPPRHKLLDRLTPDDWHFDSYQNKTLSAGLAEQAPRCLLTAPETLMSYWEPPALHQHSASRPVTQYEKQQLSELRSADGENDFRREFLHDGWENSIWN